MAIGDDFRRHLISLECDFSDEPLPERARRALVAARENGDAPPGLLEGARKGLDDWCLTGAADSQIANTDDLTAERVIAENSVAPEPESALDDVLK